MLSTRIVTALVLIPLVLAALFLLSPKAWGAVSSIVIAIAASEWASLVGFRKHAQVLFMAATLVLTLGLLLLPSFHFSDGWPDAIPLVACGAATAFWLLVVPFWLRYRWRAYAGLTSALVGWLVLIGAWVAIVQLQAESPWHVLAAMAIVWIADTAAYLVGRKFGRRKLAPVISPGKSWEGVMGGLAAVAVYAAVLALFMPDPARPGTVAGVAAWVAFVIAVSALSVTGDLFESLLKRHAGVKDSGHVLPGHGGVLDRIDALLAAMPPLALGALVLLR